jgi:hypothetical protein
MDRRNFLSTLVGGVATAAAVRTFPFRVFSFPKEVSYTGRLVSGCHDPVEVTIWRAPIGGDFILMEQISLAEAKARYGYEWRPGYSKTQQSKYDPHIYAAPLGTTTGLIRCG